MRILLAFLLCFLSGTLRADEVKVEVSPRNPVAGEPFQVKFRIFTASSEDPVINFSSGKMEVLGKSNQGVSTRTVYANGSLTVTREIMIVYDLVSKLLGPVSIRDIKVALGDKTLTHPTVSLNVVKEPVEKAEVFVQADVPKREIFLGEGIIVRYYLYSKIPVNALDIKRYPKLNRFLKRFLQEPDRMERVSVDGEIFLRSQIYAAKLFAEKVGDLKVDPLTLSVTYQAGGRQDPFGGFGMNREFKTRTLSSEQVTVKVKPLPTPVPDHYTGLVGKHEFNLNFSQSKLLVGEPLEVRLTITGPGALENVEAPVLVKHPSLEEFETTGDLKITDADLATKSFEYTFLAKNDLNLPASEKVLSYLDPDTGRYVSSQFQLPELVVAGGRGEKPLPKKEASSSVPTESEPAAPAQLSPPTWTDLGGFERYLSFLNLGLLGLAFCIVLTFVVLRLDLSSHLARRDIPSGFRRGQFSIGEFARWLEPVIKKTGKSPEAIMKDPRISPETQAYFRDLLGRAERDYAMKKSETGFVYQAKHFKKLAGFIDQIKNENV